MKDTFVERFIYSIYLLGDYGVALERLEIDQLGT
jgi:hypothetical protein